jgi:cold shock CspA family protein
MGAETKSIKRSGVLSSWDEIKGFGFVVARNSDGTRRSWFLHCTRIAHIEAENGIPEAGSPVYFDEEPHPRGPLAVNAEILALGPRIQTNAGLRALTGKSNSGGSK